MSGTLAIRRASPADAVALEWLAGLDSARPPTGEVLVAEVDGKLRAALSLSTGEAIADPFHRTLELVSLLRVRRDQMAPPARRATVRRLLRFTPQPVR